MPSDRNLRHFVDGYRSNDWSDATVLLGGGGARGLAHLGAMRAIGQSGISVGRFVGVSMGALMASLCAVHRDIQQAEIAAKEFLTSPECLALQRQVLAAAGDPSATTGRFLGMRDKRVSWSRRLQRFMRGQRFLTRAARHRSLLPSDVLEGIVNALLPDIAIEDLSTPLHLITVDLQSGNRLSLATGSLREAVICSMSIPGVFPLVRRGPRMLGDVGVYDAVPCDFVRQIMEKESSSSELIVVDVGKSVSSNASCRTAIQSVLRFQELAESQIRDFQLKQADLVIRPKFGNVPWFDFSSPVPLIDAGYEAAKAEMRSRRTHADGNRKPSASLRARS